MSIKDSGERTQFETGAVRDMHEGKGRMDLLPLTAVVELSKHCEEGALKYGEHNIDKGIPQHSLCDSGMRHLIKYMRGDQDENHLRAACWNLMWALEQSITKPELNDLIWNQEGCENMGKRKHGRQMSRDEIIACMKNVRDIKQSADKSPFTGVATLANYVLWKEDGKGQKKLAVYNQIVNDYETAINAEEITVEELDDRLWNSAETVSKTD